MTFILTARHFKAQDTLKEFAEAEIQKITRYFDGIIKTEIILSFDNSSGSSKTAEVIVHAKNHQTFTSKESTDDFKLSIESAVDKVVTQIKKYKEKLTDHSGVKSIKHLETGT
ncbi:MAG: ribosome-associated translation inhibitor RaiA [Chlorobi bacterium]|nr:ribosome-associated translation inhibitor RaiA [Chlorobiota bacterium]MCI0716147.1 ribosome-associated translation inhibitor RaiA [Chlorobiota bacterium]